MDSDDEYSLCVDIENVSDDSLDEVMQKKPQFRDK